MTPDQGVITFKGTASVLVQEVFRTCSVLFRYLFETLYENLYKTYKNTKLIKPIKQLYKTYENIYKTYKNLYKTYTNLYETYIKHV